MISTTAQFLSDIAKTDIKPVFKIFLTRRLSTGLGWEATEITITDEVFDLGELNWDWDSQGFGSFRISNLRMEVDNKDRRWDASSSRFSGFLFYNSKIRIEAGLTLSDGTVETFTMFSGVIIDHDERDDVPRLILTVSANEGRFASEIARKAGITETNILVGTGDGATLTFTFSHFAVGIVTEVRVNGVAKVPFTDYTLTFLNLKGTAAKITFTVAPPAGHAIRADYIRWKTDQRIDEVVQDLIALFTDIQIDKIQVPSFGAVTTIQVHRNKYSEFISWDRQTRVLSGSSSNNLLDVIETPPASNLGEVDLHRFTNFNFGVQGSNFKVVASVLQGDNAFIDDWFAFYEIDLGTAFQRLIDNSFLTSLGKFFGVQTGTTVAYYAKFFTTLAQMQADTFPASPFTTQGYSAFTNGSDLGSFAGNNFRYMRFLIAGKISNGDTVSALRLPAAIVSETFDLGEGFVSWDKFILAESLAGGQIDQFVISPTGEASPLESDVDGSDNIVTAWLRRTVQGVVILSSSIDSTPLFNDSLMEGQTKVTKISVANHGNLTVFEAMKQLALIGNSIFGFTAAGKFFFKDRSPTGSSVYTFDGTKEYHVTNFGLDFAGVYNRIIGIFGNFQKEANYSTESEASPTSETRFGARVLDLQQVLGQPILYLNEEDAALAEALVKFLFAKLKEPKRKTTVNARAVPHLEIGDKVTFDMQDPRQIGDAAFDSVILGMKMGFDSIEQDFRITEV